MPPDELVHDAVGDIIDRVPGAVVAFGRDARVKHHLQRDVAEFLAEGLLIAGLQRLQGLVRLLEQVRRQRGVALPGVPRAIDAQPVHGGHQVDQVSARQVYGAVHQPGIGRERRGIPRPGQPHHDFAWAGRPDAGLLDHPVGNPRLV
jgi:hypothetical protein